jgi:hypothetical protein
MGNIVQLGLVPEVRKCLPQHCRGDVKQSTWVHLMNEIRMKINDGGGSHYVVMLKN